MIQIEAGTPDTSKPTVLIENLFASGSLSVSSEAAGAEGANAVDGVTYDFWTPTSLPATIEVSKATARNANCLCIAAHDLGSKGATVILESWNGASFDVEATHEPSDDSTIMIMFPDVSVTIWRVRITGVSVPSIGNMALGERIVFSRGIVGDYTPTDWGQNVDILGGETISGQFLGQRVVARGAATRVAVGRVARSWWQTTGLVFARHYNDGKSFFFAGWPSALENDVAMCWRGEGNQELRGAILEGGFVSPVFDVNCYVPIDIEISSAAATADQGDGASSGTSTATGSGGSIATGGGTSDGGSTASGTSQSTPAAFADSDWSLSEV